MLMNQHQSIVLRRPGPVNGYHTSLVVTVDGYKSVAQAIERPALIAQVEAGICDDGAALREMNVLSIDAWRDSDGGWSWNNWRKVGTVTRREFERDCGGTFTLAERRKACKWFRDNGYLSTVSTGLVTVEDDQFNLIVSHRVTGQPLYAIEYGPAY